jgi:plastocyanin
MSAAGLNKSSAQRRRLSSATGAVAVALLLTGLAACSDGSDEKGSETTTSAPTAGPSSSTTATSSAGSSASALASARTTAAASSPTAAAGPAADVVVKISVRGRDVTPAPGRQTVAAGDRVQLIVTTDTANTLHIHGVEIEKPTKPGIPLSVEFVAKDPGVYAVELHEPELLLMQLVVR